MPFFGNKTHTSGSPAGLSPDDMYGHFHFLYMAGWGMPIPDCIVTDIHVFGDGPPFGQPDSIGQFGIYDVSSGIPANYVLVATSPTWVWGNGATNRWWDVVCSIPLSAGSYCLAVLNNGAAPFGGGVDSAVQAAGDSQRTWILRGVFPNPIGLGVTPTTHNWALYANYTVVGGAYTPTAACFSQPKCGEG